MQYLSTTIERTACRGALPKRETVALNLNGDTWTAAAMQEAAKGFRRLKAHKQLPTLHIAPEAHKNKTSHRILAC